MAIIFIDYYKQFLVILMLSGSHAYHTLNCKDIHSTYDFALLFLPHISDKVNTKYVTHLIHIHESPTFGKLINNSKYKSVYFIFILPKDQIQ